MKTLISIMLMLTLAPLTACTTLYFWSPLRWDPSGFPPFNIVVMAIFGLFTAPLWPTYFPAVVGVPLVMQVVARRRWFQAWPVARVVAAALLVGVLGGVGVMANLIRMALHESLELGMMWVAAGAVSGAVTLSAITLLHRETKTPPAP